MARYPLTDRMGDSKSVAGSPTHDHISFPNTFFKNIFKIFFSLKIKNLFFFDNYFTLQDFYTLI